MPIPDFQTILLPLLRFAGDGAEHSLREAIQNLANQFELNEEERSVKIPSGYARLFDNRVGWYRTHLLKAGLIESVRRAIFKITERGKAELSLNPGELTVSYLKKYPEYLAMFNGPAEATGGAQNEEVEIVDTPEIQFGQLYQNMKRRLGIELLDKLKLMSTEPQKFEELVLKLLKKMGYGGNFEGDTVRTPLSRDGGIDGIIKEDQLGLELIYIQAKCYNNGTVSAPEIQSFIGAIDTRANGAKKGVFMTTTRFSPGAIEVAKNSSKRVILVDGEQLANYMIDFNLGVSVKQTYQLKEVDNDFFDF